MTRRVVVVTGSTRGIGAGLAREFAARGHAVVVTGRSGAQAAAASIGDDVLGIDCDVTKPLDVQRVWDEAVATFGVVDIWVNNAGTTTTPLPLWETGVDEIAATLSTNLIGALNGLRTAIRGMSSQPNGGVIFDMLGMGSNGEVQAGLIPYGSTKAGLGYLDKALQKELKGSAVRVCSVRPGINITEHLLHGAEVLDPARWNRTKRVFNILGDLPETTTPWLVDQMLRTTKGGARIVWLTPAKISWRFTRSIWHRRDLFGDLDRPTVGSTTVESTRGSRP